MYTIKTRYTIYNYSLYITPGNPGLSIPTVCTRAPIQVHNTTDPVVINCCCARGDLYLSPSTSEATKCSRRTLTHKRPRGDIQIQYCCGCESVMKPHNKVLYLYCWQTLGMSMCLFSLHENLHSISQNLFTRT